MRWRSQVSRFAPDRVAEFDELIAEALNNPPPVQKAEQVRAGAGGELVAVEQTESGRYPGRRRDAMTATDAEKAYVKLQRNRCREGVREAATGTTPPRPTQGATQAPRGKCLLSTSGTRRACSQYGGSQTARGSTFGQACSTLPPTVSPPASPPTLQPSAPTVDAAGRPAIMYP